MTFPRILNGEVPNGVCHHVHGSTNGHNGMTIPMLNGTVGTHSEFVAGEMVSVLTRFPENVGIIGMEVYFPSTCVDQSDLEHFDHVGSGKYTVGLGQDRMAFCDDREDINSICLTVVQSLMEKYNISYEKIGRLEVGTETIIDKSKSVKSMLMQLFAEKGNTEIEGIDTTNACYGGTAALFNAINWIESSSWDGRYALVVTGDIAVYATGNARPTGGAGVVALLIGHDAPLSIERGLRGTHMEHVYDFYKPDLSSEFPEVDGKLSIACYLRALDTCYGRYLRKLEAKEGEFASLSQFDYIVFHSPFTKLVQKAFARLAFNDFLRNKDDEKYKTVQQFRNHMLEETYFDRDVEQAFMTFTRDDFSRKVVPSLMLAKELGNTYCGTVYTCLASLLTNVPVSDLINSRIGVFSYGSGLASSFFSLHVNASTTKIANKMDLKARLDQRQVVAPSEFEHIMRLRQETHNKRNYQPIGNVNCLFPGTWYLECIDEKFRRSYSRHTHSKTLSRTEGCCELMKTAPACACEVVMQTLPDSVREASAIVPSIDDVSICP